MKSFYFDTILDEENICNLEHEKEALLDASLKAKKVVVYGPRNYGKTSVVRSVIIPGFRKKNKKAFVLFVDLMQVKDLGSIHDRIRLGFEQAFREAFPTRQLLENAKKFLFNLRPQLSLDPLTGEPSLSVESVTGKSQVTFSAVFESIQKKIAGHFPTLLVLDEFQDIAMVPEAEGLMRNSLQQMKNTSIILMGSKKHLLSRLFARPNAPMAGFGEDIEFHPIPYEAYHKYISERFEGASLTLDLNSSRILQDMLFRVPEAINIVCAYLVSSYQQKTIQEGELSQAIEEVVSRRKSRYEEFISFFSEKEEKTLTAMAKASCVKQPTGKAFLQSANITSRAMGQMIRKFLDLAVIEKTNDGYRIADPLLYYFLRRYR